MVLDLRPHIEALTSEVRELEFLEACLADDLPRGHHVPDALHDVRERLASVRDTLSREQWYAAIDRTEQGEWVRKGQG